jgi:hypothetical protein
MMHLVHIDPRLEGQIRNLRRAGKKGRIAANHVEAVIAVMKRGGPGEARQLPQTHKGELRLDGCIKYDLGGGYRLLTVKQGKERFVLYAGSHDECDRWLANNRDLAIDAIRERCCHYFVPWDSARTPGDREPDDTGCAAQWTPPESEVDQRALRLVFAGLCGSN